MQRNAFEVIAEVLEKVDYLESAKNLIGDTKPEDTAMLYATIAQAQAMERIAAALEKLTDNCVDTMVGALIVTEFKR